MHAEETRRFVGETWDGSIVPTLVEYVKIPNKSPSFDSEWAAHGHMDRAAALAEQWCRAQDIPGMSVEVVRLAGRTPLLYIEVPGGVDDTVLLYGHLDKQPEFTGWSEGLGPWTPVIRDGRLYGRGGADDGYAVFASLTAIRALRAQGVAHARCVVVIEFCEESGSFDLPHYIAALEGRIGTPSLVVCLDAECGNYEQLWCTTTLRGNVVGNLSIDVLTEGVHSGAASGIVPSSFRILRMLLARVEDERSGRLIPEILHATVPAQRRRQAEAAAATLGATIYSKFPWAPGMRPVKDELAELVLDNTWGSTLCVTGAAGIPDLGNAGNVLRPNTTVKLSFRLPPTTDAARAARELQRLLEADPPYGARVRFQVQSAMGGWSAPELSPWLERSMHAASRAHFGADAMYLGTGGSIPFMGMLGEKYPGVQFLVTGLLGPKSNAHGPNEFLDIATGKKLTACVAQVLADHAARKS
jgi:acetylornithine deacetylase/succinyl-diaminopimelate desuccinylase-like protein